MNRRAVLLSMIFAPLLASCERENESVKPRPREVTDASVAQFCGMNLTEHGGPKAQIFVKGLPDPYWFATVRDAFAFLMLPETPKAVAAVFVNDMSRAKNWDQPERGVWIEAAQAVYVIESRRRSGMNSAEAIPFGASDAAAKFVREEGGRTVRFDEMPREYILTSQSGDP